MQYKRMHDDGSEKLSNIFFGSVPERLIYSPSAWRLLAIATDKTSNDRMHLLISSKLNTIRCVVLVPETSIPIPDGTDMGSFPLLRYYIMNNKLVVEEMDMHGAERQGYGTLMLQVVMRAAWRAGTRRVYAPLSRLDGNGDAASYAARNAFFRTNGFTLRDGVVDGNGMAFCNLGLGYHLRQLAFGTDVQQHAVQYASWVERHAS